MVWLKACRPAQKAVRYNSIRALQAELVEVELQTEQRCHKHHVENAI